MQLYNNIQQLILLYRYSYIAIDIIATNLHGIVRLLISFCLWVSEKSSEQPISVLFYKFPFSADRQSQWLLTQATKSRKLVFIYKHDFRRVHQVIPTKVTNILFSVACPRPSSVNYRLPESGDF